MSVPALPGSRELVRFMEALPDEMARKVVRGGARAAMKVIADEARLKAHSREVRNSIRYGARNRGDVITAKVQTRGDGAYLAPWEEFGTAPHIITARGRQAQDRATVVRINKAAKKGQLLIGRNFVGPLVHHPGAKAHPFMRPALDAKAGEALQAMADYIRVRLTREGLLGADETDDDIE